MYSYENGCKVIKMVVYNQIGCIQLKNGCNTTILNENGCILMKMVVIQPKLYKYN